VEIAEHAASLGLLNPAQVDEVRAETQAPAPRTWPEELLRHLPSATGDERTGSPR
jgi:hypothetical protein